MKSLRPSSQSGRSSYDLTIPPVVHFGHGRIAEVGHVATVLGKRIWLVVGVQQRLQDDRVHSGGADDSSQAAAAALHQNIGMVEVVKEVSDRQGGVRESGPHPLEQLHGVRHAHGSQILCGEDKV